MGAIWGETGSESIAILGEEETIIRALVKGKGGGPRIKSDGNRNWALGDGTKKI